MSDAPLLEPAHWTQRRWLYNVALVFLIQVGLIFLLSKRSSAPAPAPSFGARLGLAMDAWSEQQLARRPGLGDPTLFALPSLQGFSGGAWLTFAPLEHSVSNWVQPDLWLELDVSSLGGVFLNFITSNAAPPFLVGAAPLPPLAGSNRRGNNPFAAERSSVLIDGDLARRPLLRPLQPPARPHHDILTNTVVQLLVDAKGDSIAQTLLSSCGVDETDQIALKLAADARFQSLRAPGNSAIPSGQVTWGKMIFHWQTVAPPATNAASRL
jgi:hypothetical protein